MYIRKTTKTHKDKTYDNYLLVESLHTPKGPRQRILCSLGSLAPAPREHWLNLAHRVQASLAGQLSLTPTDAPTETLVEKGRRGRKARPAASQSGWKAVAAVAVDSERVSIEAAREAGGVHVGHQMWGQLGLNEILSSAGLSERACRLSEAMTLNRLLCPLSEHAMPDWIRKFLLDHKHQNPHARIARVEHVVVAIDVIHVKLVGVHPLCWPGLSQFKPIAAVLEAGCAFDDYRPLDAETVFPAENGVEALVGNADVAAFPGPMVLIAAFYLLLLMLTAVLFLSALS